MWEGTIEATVVLERRDGEGGAAVNPLPRIGALRNFAAVSRHEAVPERRAAIVLEGGRSIRHSERCSLNSAFREKPMQLSLGPTRNSSSFALAALVVCAAAASAPAQVPLQTTVTDARAYDLSINTAANRAIVRGWTGQHDFFDLTTGAPLALPPGTASPWALTPFVRMVKTAVTTNTRALSAGIDFVFGWGTTGGTIQLFDLTTAAPSLLVPPISSAPVVPHDIALARNDKMAVINGHDGVMWLQMTTGANFITTHIGGPFTNTTGLFCHGSMVQSVLANDKRAVVLRSSGGAGAIDLYDTSPFPGAAPVLVSTTLTFDSVSSQPVEPYDLAMSPDQNWVGVMTNGGDFYVVDLQANTVTAAPGVGLAIDPFVLVPDPFDFFDIKDSVQLTNSVAVVAGIANGGVAPPLGNIGVYDLATPATGPAFFTIAGQPHDLAVSPDQQVAAVHASAAHATPGGLMVLALNGAAGTVLQASLPSAGFERIWSIGSVVQDFPSMDPKEPPKPVEGECWEQEVLESVRLTDSRLAVIGNDWDTTAGLPIDFSSAGSGYIEFYDTTVTPTAPIVSHRQSLGTDGDVHDLDLSPNGAILGVYGESVPTPFFKMSDGLLYGTGGNVPTGTGNITYPHAVDAINLDDTRSVCAASFTSAGGNPGIQNVAFDDTCAAIPQIINVGCQAPGTWVAPAVMGITAGSSTSIAANNLTLQCTGVGQTAPGRFYYGPRILGTPVFVPTGGYNCLTNPLQRLQVINAALGVLTYTLDYGAPPNPSGLISPGDTWYFQCSYRDLISNPSFTTNASDALQVTFGP